MWEYFTLKRARARKILVDAAREKHEGKQGQFQQEPPFKEVLEQATFRAYIAIKQGLGIISKKIQERK